MRWIYRNGLASLGEYALERGVDFAALELPDIISFKEHLQGRLSAGTVSTYLTGIRSFYAWTECTRTVSGIAKSAMRAIGLDDRRHTAHSLRHTAVTYALLGGAKVEEAQEMARHANINTTLIYSHHVDRIQNAAERKIESILDV